MASRMREAASLAAASAIADLEENTLIVIVAPLAGFKNIILQFVTQRCKKKVIWSSTPGVEPDGDQYVQPEKPCIDRLLRLLLIRLLSGRRTNAGADCKS